MNPMLGVFIWLGLLQGRVTYQALESQYVPRVSAWVTWPSAGPCPPVLTHAVYTTHFFELRSKCFSWRSHSVSMLE